MRKERHLIDENCAGPGFSCLAILFLAGKVRSRMVLDVSSIFSPLEQATKADSREIRGHFRRKDEKVKAIMREARLGLDGRILSFLLLC